VTLTCSAGRLALGEPLAGSAPYARLWIMLEQPGPWGRDAVRESHLDADTAEAMAALPGGHPVRVGLIRAVGEHADVKHRARTLLVARTDPGVSWVAARQIDDVQALPLQLDIDALLAAASTPSDLLGVRLPTPSRALLVCTNAKRDQCCAVLGRPLAAFFEDQAAAGQSVQVWETSHTSGHRFAPTYLSLPDGYLFGGPGSEHATVDACRGRSSLEPKAQVAELAVLRELGVSTPRPLEVSPIDELTYLVRDNGDVFTVSLEVATAPDRPESCGKAAVPASWFTSTVTRA
jgi:hypothetical protein